MKVTIVTATYNSERTLNDCIRSVAMQLCDTDVEHLIVDGQSTDSTVAVASGSGVPVGNIVSETDDGIYDAMNKGFRRATGNIIGLVNSDDMLAATDVIQSVVEAFESTGADLIYGDLLYVDKETASKPIRYWKSGRFKPGSMLRGWAPAHPTVYFRRELLERVGYFDLQYPLAADFDWMFRAFEVHAVNVSYLPKVMTKMRVGGATGGGFASVLQQNQEIIAAMQSSDYSPGYIKFVGGKLIIRGQQYLSARRERL